MPPQIVAKGRASSVGVIREEEEEEREIALLPTDTQPCELGHSPLSLAHTHRAVKYWHRGITPVWSHLIRMI